MVIFFHFQTTSNHLHPLQVENCDSNSRLVLDEDDNGKFRLERVNGLATWCGFPYITHFEIDNCCMSAIFNLLGVEIFKNIYPSLKPHLLFNRNDQARFFNYLTYQSQKWPQVSHPEFDQIDILHGISL